MFVRSLACAFALLAGATAQESSLVPVTSIVSAINSISTVPAGASQSSAEGFMTIQTSVPSSLVPSSVATDGPLTNPLRTSETIPQLTFCNGIYTNTPCSSATGQMSIPQGETPLPSSAVASETASSSPVMRSSSGTVSRPAATSSVSGSVPTPSTQTTPGAAASIMKHDGSFIWVAALSGLSATLGFAWTLL